MTTTDEKLDALMERLERIEARVNGLPLIGESIAVLQRDVRTINDEMRVATAIAQRGTNMMPDLLEELRAIHRWMINTGDRIRKLEHDG